MTRLLLVEDNEMNRDMLTRRLKRKGFEIDAAGDGEQALVMIQKSMPDLVLMDMNLPIKNGWMTCQEIRANPNTEKLPVIALTAHAMAEDKQKALDAALSQIESQFGKGTVMRMGDQERVAIPSISTGSLGLDIALGIGGLPKGRIVEIYGPESSGKTTLTLQVIAEAQKAGGTAAFIDAEHALDPQYADKLGVQVDDLIMSQPDTGEQALEVAEMLVRSGAVDVLVVDSVAALTPKAEIEGEMGDSHVGLQARLLSQAMRKLTGAIKQTNCLVIFINQIRMKIGVMFGSPETTTGGNALKFYSSVRLDIRRIGAVKEGDEVVGNETRVKVVKNKVSPPFRQAEFQIMYGGGIYHMGEVIDWGVKLNLIDKSGAWYAYKGDKIGQGKANASKFLEENAAVAKEIEDQIRHQMMGLPLAAVETEVAEAPVEESDEPDIGEVAESS